MKPIPDEHLAKMRTALRIGDSMDLPDGLEDVYWDFKKMADRLSKPLVDSDFVSLLVMHSKLCDRPIPDDKKDFAEVIQQGKVEFNDTVLVQWRGKEVEGRYQGTIVTAGIIKQVIVQIGDDNRKLAPSKVKLPKAA